MTQSSSLERKRTQSPLSCDTLVTLSRGSLRRSSYFPFNVNGVPRGFIFILPSLLVLSIRPRWQTHQRSSRMLLTNSLRTGRVCLGASARMWIRGRRNLLRSLISRNLLAVHCEASLMGAIVKYGGQANTEGSTTQNADISAILRVGSQLACTFGSTLLILFFLRRALPISQGQSESQKNVGAATPLRLS